MFKDKQREAFEKETKRLYDNGINFIQNFDLTLEDQVVIFCENAGQEEELSSLGYTKLSQDQVLLAGYCKPMAEELTFYSISRDCILNK